MAHAILNTAGVHTRKWRTHNVVVNMAPGNDHGSIGESPKGWRSLAVGVWRKVGGYFTVGHRT